MTQPVYETTKSPPWDTGLSPPNPKVPTEGGAWRLVAVNVIKEGGIWARTIWTWEQIEEAGQ